MGGQLAGGNYWGTGWRKPLGKNELSLSLLILVFGDINLRLKSLILRYLKLYLSQRDIQQTKLLGYNIYSELILFLLSVAQFSFMFLTFVVC